MSRILKWAVPVDDQWHPIGPGPVVLVGKSPDEPGIRTAYVWTLEPDTNPRDASDAQIRTAARSHPPREACVVGTGQLFDGWGCSHLGSYVAAPFVWHVLGRVLAPAAPRPTPDEAEGDQ